MRTSPLAFPSSPLSLSITAQPKTCPFLSVRTVGACPAAMSCCPAAISVLSDDTGSVACVAVLASCTCPFSSRSISPCAARCASAPAESATSPCCATSFVLREQRDSHSATLRGWDRWAAGAAGSRATPLDTGRVHSAGCCSLDAAGVCPFHLRVQFLQPLQHPAVVSCTCEVQPYCL